MNEQNKQQPAQQPSTSPWGIGALAVVGVSVWGFFWLLREQERRDRDHLAKMGRYV